MTNVRRLAAALALALVPALALAQTPAPAAAPTAVAKPNCQSPGDHPGRLASDNQQRSWARDARAYLDCLKKFIEEQKALAVPLIERAKPYQDAANAAIEVHNKAQLDFIEQQKKASE
jgi:hypothetical protein